MGVWTAGICYSAYCAGLLWWTNALGDFAAGSWNLPAWAVLIGVPLGSVWLLYASFVLMKVSRPWFLVLAIGTSVLTVPLMLQPWNPRVQFVARLDSLKGMSPSQAQVEMKGYFGGELTPIDVQYIPDEFSGLGITHSMSYRWNETDGRYNADVGTAYVSGKTVVATDFSPD